MRNVVIILFMIVMGSTGLQAQTEKGRWTVGAQVGDLSYSNSGDFYKARSFSASLSPSAGYFVAKNLAIGALMPISYASSSYIVPNNDPYRTKGASVGLAPFVRYYIGSAKLRPFANASVGFQQYWASRKGFGNTETQRDHFNQTNYSVGVGAAYFINNTVSLDASLNYTNGLGGSGFRQTGRADLNVGFRLFFGK